MPRHKGSKRKVWFGVFVGGKLIRGPAATMRKAEFWKAEIQAIRNPFKLSAPVEILRYESTRW